MLDAWIDHDKTKMKHDVSFTRYFFRYVLPRSLEEIGADLKNVSAEIQELVREIAA